MENQSLQDQIRNLAQPLEGCQSIRFENVRRLAEQHGSVREVELMALRWALSARYIRNVGTIGVSGQRSLLRAQVAIVGLGGLGGYVAEALARMGVGRLVLIDGDVFEDHNLNRQLLSREENLGAQKACAACERVAAVNAAVETVCHQAFITRENVCTLLEGAEVVVDALDRLPARLMLQDGARDLGIPMVHGTIGGFLGQVMTIFPEDSGLHGLYGDGAALPEQGLESELGTPAATPMAVAAWQAQEVVKILTGYAEPLRDRLLVFDMASGTSHVLQLG